MLKKGKKEKTRIKLNVDVEEESKEFEPKSWSSIPKEELIDLS